MKTCKDCGESKEFANFNKHPTNSDRMNHRCRLCEKKYKHEHYERNKERIKAKSAAWATENSDRVRERLLAWRKHNRWKNKPSENEYNRRWKAIKKWGMTGCVPKWANLSRIKDIYREASIMTRQLGEPHEVDHIIPLVNAVVCGLHVENNLRIVKREVNQRKQNYLLAEFC